MNLRKDHYRIGCYQTNAIVCTCMAFQPRSGRPKWNVGYLASGIGSLKMAFKPEGKLLPSQCCSLN